LSAQALKVGAARFFLFLESLAVFFDDQQVVRRGECGQALGKKVIAREAGSDVDQLAWLTDVRHGLGEQHMDVAILGSQRMVLAPLDAGLTRRAGGCLLGLERIARLASGLLPGRCLGRGRGALWFCRLGHEKGSFSSVEAGEKHRRTEPASTDLLLGKNYIKSDLGIPAKWCVCAPGGAHVPQHRTGLPLVGVDRQRQGMRRRAPRGMSERDVFLVAFLGLGRRAASRIRGGRVRRPAGTGTGAVALAARLARAGRWSTPRSRLAHGCRGATQLIVTRRARLAAAITAARVEELNAIGLNADLRPFFACRLVVPRIHTQIPFHVNGAAFAEVLATCFGLAVPHGHVDE